MLAWAPSVDCSRSCHARSTTRRIAYECNFWPVERDLQDVCRQPCSNSTAYSEVSIRAGNLPQPEFPLPDSNGAKSESKVDDQEGDAERFQGRTGVENRVRNYVHDFSRKLEAPQTAVPRDQWSSGRTLGPTKGELTGAVSRNQLHPNSPDSFELERCSSLRSSPTTSHQRVLSHAATEGGVEGAVTRGLRIGEEASDCISQAPLLTNIFQLAERATSPHDLVAEGLDGSESLRSSRGGPLKERSNPWSENVELVRSGPFFFHENTVECSTDIGASERDDAGFHNVIIAQASHGKAAEPTPVGESGTPRSQRGHHSHVHSQGRQEIPKTVNAVSGSPKSQPLTDLAARGALCNALDIDSIPQSSGGDQPQQGSTSARIERGPTFSRITSDIERDLEEIATTRGRRYTERVGNVGVGTEPTAGRQINPDRTGDTPTGWKSQDTAGRTAGVLTVIPERIGRTSDSLTVRELVGVSESQSAGERVGGAESYSAQEGTGGSTESRLTIRERTGGSPSEGNKIPERIGAGSERDSAEEVLEKGKEEKLHPREEGHQRQSESSEDRRLRARLDGASGRASGGGDDTEEPKIVRPARPSGGKDRHSKVNTAKGPRDRRVRLSVPTAVQFYDVQDRLGFDQPSKAVEWLIQKAKDAIDRIPVDGKDPRVPGACGSDISHHVPAPSSYDAAVSGLVSGSLSCTPAGSFQGPSSNPYGDQLSFLMDPSTAQGMFAPLQATQGNFSGPTFGLGRIDLTRGNSGSISTDGGRTNESTGSPLARVESRTKARERARERTKKGPGRDGSQGNVTSGGSPSSSQSPPFNPNPTFSSFNASNSMQGSVHSLSLQSQHQTPLLSGIYEGNPFSRILQGSHQTGSFQNLVLHNPPLDSSQFSDQIQSPLQNAFLAQAQATLQSPSHTMNPLHQPQLQTMQVNAQGALHLGPTFNPGPSSSSLSEASMSSPHYPSVSALPSSQSPPVPQLSVLGMSPVSSLGSHYPTGSPTPIPPGFSPGPTASAFRAHSLSISQCSNQSQQQQLQGVSRVQRPVPTFSAAPSISIPTSQAGSSSSRAPAHPFYLGTSSNTFMGCLQPIQSERLNSPSFSTRSNVSYEHGQRPRSIVSSPRLPPYQASNSQIPARIQGLDDMEELEEELNPATPSSPHP